MVYAGMAVQQDGEWLQVRTGNGRLHAMRPRDTTAPRHTTLRLPRSALARPPHAGWPLVPERRFGGLRALTPG